MTNPSPQPADNKVILGRVSGLFGVRGWVKVFSETEPREQIFDYPRWQLRLRGRWTPVEVIEGAAHNKVLIAQLAGYQDRDQSAALVGADIGIERSELPDPGDAYYWHDLQGMEVVTTQGKSLGQVDHLFSTGANDVVVVQGERERMLPWIRPDVIVEVDLQQRRITVDWDPEF